MEIGKVKEKISLYDDDDEIPSILEKIVKRARTFGEMFALM